MPESKAKGKGILIRQGRIIDPANGRDGVFDLLVEGGRIAGIGKNLPGEGVEIVNVDGNWILPGLIDLHVHLREPGFEYKETVLTGSMAAAAGGFTAVACMPNTDPVNDCDAVTKAILRKAAEAGLARVYPVGCITEGQKGERIAEIGSLAEAGCRAVSDDGRPVMNAGVMRRAMEYCRHFDIPLLSHCEDLDLVEGGVMHEGDVSTRLGLKPITPAAEEVMAARDILLSKETGARLHLAHVSTRGTVGLVRFAKEEGISVTAEATPHHLMLTADAVSGYDTDTKVNPPLRSVEDVDALREGVRDGIIDVIATDHAPHSLADKEVDYDAAAFGMVGLETALPLVMKLVDDGVLSLERAIDSLTSAPARILGVEGGTLSVGSPADLIVVDPEEEYTVNEKNFFSKGRNTPFKGWKLKGKVKQTFLEGRAVYRDGEHRKPAGNGSG